MNIRDNREMGSVTKNQRYQIGDIEDLRLHIVDS